MLNLRARRLPPACLIVLLTFLSACGGSGGEGGAAASASASPPDSAGAPAPGSATSTSADSPGNSDAAATVMFSGRTVTSGPHGSGGPLYTVNASCQAPPAPRPAHDSAVTIAADGSYRFTEKFQWLGNHAATVASGAGTTVWWQPDRWDVRVDTSYLAIADESYLQGRSGWNHRPGWHVDIHKAKTPADPRDGREDNSLCLIGGDGSAGIGTMRMQHQGIAAARLRNPMLISSATPGVVSFYVSRFHTTAHWAEIAITPAARVAGGDATAVSGDFDGDIDELSTGYCDGRVTPCTAGNGPGHRRAEDSINVIFNSPTDVPEITGWYTQFQLIKIVNSESQTGFGEHFVKKIAGFDELIQTDPSEAYGEFPDLNRPAPGQPGSGIDMTPSTLAHWRIEYFPTHVDVFVERRDIDETRIRGFSTADVKTVANEDGTTTDYWKMYSFPVTVPWPEVYVHLIGGTYQADHHPQSAFESADKVNNPWFRIRDVGSADISGSAKLAEGGYLGPTREMHWRDVRVGPVKYKSTSVAPQDGVMTIDSRQAGWMAYDVRDTQRFGVFDFAGITGVSQPNAAMYDEHSQMLFTTDYEYAWPWGAPNPNVAQGDEAVLYVDLDARQAAAAAGRIVYDVRQYDAGNPNRQGTGFALLYVNGTQMPALLKIPDGHPARLAYSNSDWVHTSSELAMTDAGGQAVLKPGRNEIRLRFSGHIQLDRLQLEFDHLDQPR